MLPLALDTLVKVERVEILRHSESFWTVLEEVDLGEAYWTLHLFADRDGSAEAEIELSHIYPFGSLEHFRDVQVVQAIVGALFERVEWGRTRVAYLRAEGPIPTVEESEEFIPLTLENLKRVVEIRTHSKDAAGLYLETCDRNHRNLFPTPQLSPSIFQTTGIGRTSPPSYYVEQLVGAVVGRKFVNPTQDGYSSVRRPEVPLEAQAS